MGKVHVAEEGPDLLRHHGGPGHDDFRKLQGQQPPHTDGQHNQPPGGQPGDHPFPDGQLAGLAAGYERLREAPSGETAFPGATLFVKGGDSPYIQAEHEPEIARRFPHSNVKTIDGAGHWVHIDQPEQFFEITRSHLRGLPGDQRPE